MTNIERNIMKNNERLEWIQNNPKKYSSVLKAQRTKLLNRKCETLEEFAEVQEKLNVIEFELKNYNK